MGGNMMKKISMMLLIILIMLCLTVFAACPEKEPEVEKEKITTLIGTWKETLIDEERSDVWLEVEITSESITVYQVKKNYGEVEKTVSFKGNYSDPAESFNEYTFTSTDRSDPYHDRIRTFAYADGKLKITIERGMGEFADINSIDPNARYAYLTRITESN